MTYLSLPPKIDITPLDNSHQVWYSVYMMKKEMTYKEVLALSTERMGIFGYYPHEIEKAAKAWYKELVEEKLEKEI